MENLREENEDVLKNSVKGKRVVLVDDSIVRGTTSIQIIDMLKKAGAKEVHLRISSPPFLCPCFFGIDVPEASELIAHKHTKEEITKILGADSLDYLDTKNLSKIVENLNICKGCFTGKYPIKNIHK